MTRSVLLVVLAALSLAACDSRPPPPAPAAQVPAPAPVVEAPAPLEPDVAWDVKVGRIRERQTLATALVDLGLPMAQVNELVGALEGVFDFRKSRVGDQLRVTLRGGQVEYFEYRKSFVDEWYVRREGERMVGGKREVEVEKRVGTVALHIESSLYESMVSSGEDPSLAMAIADVLAWDVDFYQDVRKGDEVRAVVEKYIAKGRILRYGEVLAVSYTGETVGSRKLYRYQPRAGEVTWFDQSGNSAKKAFLKSPLKYAHVTSKFGGRIHPVLNYYKQHQGVDYAAAVGTPVWSVSDGVVTRAVKGDPAAGNYVFIRHANGFETAYLHLSRIGDGVRAGARVRQKQVIGLTGATGRVTGPHLHFG
ncbi:MAG: peptidoglycan DD-metalloendopeptidase family protein, partial [Myxococcales bacterium]